jgi:hypothetical protein
MHDIKDFFLNKINQTIQGAKKILGGLITESITETGSAPDCTWIDEVIKEKWFAYYSKPLPLPYLYPYISTNSGGDKLKKYIYLKFVLPNTCILLLISSNVSFIHTLFLYVKVNS